MNDDIKILLANYIAGNINEVDKIKVEEWIAFEPGNQQLYVDLQQAWNTSLYSGNNKRLSVDEAYRLLEHKLKSRKIIPFKQKIIWYAAAAVIVLIAGTAIFFQ